MRPWNLPLACLLTMVLSFAAYPQTQTPKSAMELGSTGNAEVEVESTVQTGLNRLLTGLQASVAHLKKNEWTESEASLQDARDFLKKAREKLKLIPEDEERELSLSRIDSALDEADYSLKEHRKPQALADLSRAYQLTMALSKSPILKLTASKVSLYLANQQIESKNYTSAGEFLDHAIDSLTAIQDDPNVDQQEIRSLKNAIVVTHQQVILGKRADGSYMSKLYERATAATSNAFYRYYDMWTRTPVPWDVND